MKAGIAAKADRNTDEEIIDNLLEKRQIENENIIIRKLLKNGCRFSHKKLLEDLYNENQFKALRTSLSEDAYLGIIKSYATDILKELGDCVEVDEKNIILTREGKQKILNFGKETNYISLMTPKQSEVIQKIIASYPNIVEGSTKDERKDIRDRILEQISNVVYTSKENIDSEPLVNYGILKRISLNELKNEETLNAILRAKYTR